METDSNISKIIKLLERTRSNLKADCDIKIGRIESAITLLKQNSLNPDLLTILNIAVGLNSSEESEKSIVNTLELFDKKNPELKTGKKLKGPVTKRIMKLLDNEQKFLHNKQIAEIIADDFPWLTEAQMSQKLSSVLSNLKKQNKITMYVDGRSSKKTYWGKKHWMNDGRIKSGFEFKKIE